MERKTMKEYQKTSGSLGQAIEYAIAMLDPKGTDTQVSRAMSIVRMAFAHPPPDARISPRCLYEKAVRMFPLDSGLQNQPHLFLKEPIGSRFLHD
jgi:hypothetical protein